MTSKVDTEFPMLWKLGYLNKDTIRIKDKKRVEDSLGKLIDGGFKNLQLVADFDNTLTRFHNNGSRCESSWGILDNSTNMPQCYRDEALALFHKYYPIETDPFMKEEEKVPYVIEWYDKIKDLLEKFNVQKGALEGMVQNSNCLLRDRTTDLLNNLQKKDVPVLILSAGMGDIVQHVLWHFDIYSKNVKVISNFFKYNDEGIMVGFTGDMIHVYNKNGNAADSSNYYDVQKDRTSVILLGDSIGDTKMAAGLPDHSNVLKIGFLNDKIEANLEAYLQAFDIVLLDDQTMDAINSIMLQLK